MISSYLNANFLFFFLRYTELFKEETALFLHISLKNCAVLSRSHRTDFGINYIYTCPPNLSQKKMEQNFIAEDVNLSALSLEMKKIYNENRTSQEEKTLLLWLDVLFVYTTQLVFQINVSSRITFI